MNLYESMQFEKEVEGELIKNDGELSEEQWQELVEHELATEGKIEGLVKYIKVCDSFVANCDTELRRIKKLKETMLKRTESIKQYMNPYVESKGKDYMVGTFILNASTSKKVDTVTGFNNPDYTTKKETIVISPDKKKIRKDLDNDIVIEGAFFNIEKSIKIK